MSGQELYEYWALRVERFKGSMPSWSQLQFREQRLWVEMAAEAIGRAPF